MSRSKPRRISAPTDPAARRPILQTNQPGTASAPKSYLDPIVWLVLVLSVFAVYSQVGHYDFINFDDPSYVTDNVHVRAGLTPESIRWALTAVVVSHWVPLTMLSHMAVCGWFGLESGAHHWVNVVLHALSTVLLFAAFRRATRAVWPSVFVAFIFALHPLHVESVAWISERKDVLCTFFWFLALYAYVRYSERPGLARYLLVAAPFCLALISKPMAVTFPFSLLLFDIWPLRRAQLPRTLWEKTPLFALSIASCLVTYFSVRSGRATTLPFEEGLRNALISYVSYIGQMFWPTGLAIYYPFRTSVTVLSAVLALTFLAGVSALAIFTWRTRPYFATGWFWYLGILVPVIGLLQVGLQAHADRYMYVPMIGLTVILAWGAADVVRKWPRAIYVIAPAGVISCLACWGVASTQVEYWRTSESLYQHALSVTENNYLAQSNLGDYLAKIPGRRPEAVAHYEEALRIQPNSVAAHNQIGGYLMATGHHAEGIAHFEAALRTEPDNAEANFNLGVVFSKTPGRELDAIAHYQAAMRGNPQLAPPHRNLGLLLQNLGRTAEAIAQLEAAQRIQYDPAVAKILDKLHQIP